MPLLIALAGTWAAIHFGLVPPPQSRQAYEASVFVPFGTMFALYLVAQILRAPSVLDAERSAEVATVTQQRDSALESLRPKITIDFQNTRDFIEITRLDQIVRGRPAANASRGVAFIHVKPKCLGSSVSGCMGYLTEIAVPDGSSWQVVFARAVPLFWSGHEDEPKPQTLHENVPVFLDIGYSLEGDSSINLIHPLAALPNAMPRTIGPMDIFRLTIAVVGDNNAKATIRLIVQPGSVWSAPTIEKDAEP
jgi:hypothetical protein